MMESQSNWRKRTILFFASQCITLFGSQIVQMAIVWYVTLQTNSGAWVAAFSVCSYLPQFFVSFIGGVWADRYNRKYLIIGADALIAAVTLAMMLIMPYITAEPILLAALLFMSIIRSAGAGIQNPAVNAVIPQLVPEEHLMRYNGINATMQSVVQFGAPAAAAVVLTMSTLRATLLIDILTAVIGIGVFSCILLPKQEKSQEMTSVLADIGVGIRYAHSCMVVRKTLVIYGLFVFLTVPAGYLSGLLVSRVFGDTYWYLTAVELIGFGGMMLGGLLISIWGGFKSRRLTLVAGLVMFGTMAIGMGVSSHFILYLILMALYGIALTMVQTTITTMLQENSETSMQGRVFGLMSSLYSSCYPIGMALFGPLADTIPLQWIMVISGIALITVAGIAYCDRHLKFS
ncbi:MAG: MFS transporter [Oscillospiraceae bacterium]|nr:MFS transporter [Oscillospiraceae bacterium]